jgi:hypothetical protein
VWEVFRKTGIGIGNAIGIVIDLAIGAAESAKGERMQTAKWKLQNAKWMGPNHTRHPTLDTFSFNEFPQQAQNPQTQNIADCRGVAPTTPTG